ncbi:hypothetical protein BaRGS_00024458, partial [Batillaria attramentaria]
MPVCCLILILLPLSCMGGDVTQTVFSNIADDVMFDECLINSMTARSKLDCARRCSSDPNCKTFTFTKGSPTGTCRLHSHVMTLQSPRSAAPGARSYTVKTEEVLCGVDADGWTVYYVDGWRSVYVEDWVVCYVNDGWMFRFIMLMDGRKVNVEDWM